MRKSNFYGVDVPELGDRADITVVSQAIIDGENNQSGRIEHLKATNSGTTLILSSETRADKLIKYYNGLSIQFVSPVNITAGNSYKIKIDNLAEQPYNNKIDIKAGDIVQAYYGASGFVSSNTPIPRSSSTSSSSEVTVATSLAVKNANDNANTRALKTTQIIAGKGLIGGGSMSTNRTIDVVSKNDGIIVNDNNIQLNVYDGVDSSSTTRAGSAKAVKAAYDKANNALPKTGGTVNGWIRIVDGKLEIKRDGYPEVAFYKQSSESGGAVGYATSSNKTYLRSSSSSNILYLSDDGTVSFGAINLDTNSKDVIEAINELNTNKFDKTGGTLNGGITMNSGYLKIRDGRINIRQATYPEVTFINSNNESDRGAVGYAVAGEYAYLRGGSINGYTNVVELHDDGTSKYPAKNLNTKNKEVVQAINELYSDFRYIGSALSVNAVIPFSEYREYLIFGRYAEGSYCGFYYLDSTMLSALPIKTLSFYSSILEGSFTIDASNKRFKVTNVGDGNGGIDVFAR